MIQPDRLDTKLISTKTREKWCRNNEFILIPKDKPISIQRDQIRKIVYALNVKIKQSKDKPKLLKSLVIDIYNLRDEIKDLQLELAWLENSISSELIGMIDSLKDNTNGTEHKKQRRAKRKVEQDS